MTHTGHLFSLVQIIKYRIWTTALSTCSTDYNLNIRFIILSSKSKYDISLKHFSRGNVFVLIARCL